MNTTTANEKLDALLHRLESVRAAGDGWSARCPVPAHDDRRASLSINAGDDGRLLVCCHKGCAAAEIVGAVGLTMADLMPANESHGSNGHAAGNGKHDRAKTIYPTAADAIGALASKRGPPSASWRYENAAGEHIGTALRWDRNDGTKDILPISRNGSGWKCAGMPEPRPLYQLPTLAAAQQVVVVEGEKAADAGRSIGLTTTTSANGALSPGKTDWTPLAGKDVVIHPDNDEPGREYAERVAVILTKLNPPASVKIVVLPGLPDGGDLVEWIVAHGDAATPEVMRNNLQRLVDAAPEWKSMPEPIDAQGEQLGQHESTADGQTTPRPSYKERLTIKAEPADRFGKCVLHAFDNEADIFHDQFNPFDGYRRGVFSKAVYQKLRGPSRVATAEDVADWNASGDDSPPDLSWIDDQIMAAAKSAAGATEGKPRPLPVNITTLAADHPHLAEPVIDGILRRGETGNIIAAPKVGKSWLGYGVGLSVATGNAWLGQFPCYRGRVLLIDNELFPATIAHRIPTSADGHQIQRSNYADRFDVLSLRGQLMDLNGIALSLEAIEPGQYDLVILDALYRAQPAGFSENDNAMMAGLFNTIDQITARLGCAWLNIHHASKGEQGSKAVTDVGAGAGAQSRAADTHIILRPHEDEGAVVLEAVVRSFPPINPLPLRWNFPTWWPDETIDAAAVKGRLNKQQQRQCDLDNEGSEVILTRLREGSTTARKLREHTGFSPDRLTRLCDKLVAAGKIVSGRVKIGGNRCRKYKLKPTGNEDSPNAKSDTDQT